MANQISQLYVDVPATEPPQRLFIGDKLLTCNVAVINCLEQLVDQLGKTIVMVTHDPKAAARAHRIVHLEKGVLVDELPA